ncbi:MAG: LacI family DNA-binding transcriptional regulator [Ardenticatenaceae bacterium]|nr:LacI family DNA-binding transcriptional regulator [Ardenticatenaceae bacterium]MCB9445113.1 LacI family DNA-binding transcriptional regulator [Ardenticatenaceae bacterium]
MASVTIRDVAKKAGVGVGTVSRVINQSPSVSLATREKVLSAIAELKYTPSPIARRLSLGKTMTIGVITPFFTRSSYIERLRGVESVLSQSEYDFIIYNVETVERRDKYFREIPRRERIDGLMIMSLPPTDEDTWRFAESEVPTVLVDAAHPSLSRVVIDDVDGGYKAAMHLIELGHRKIGYISDYMKDSPFHFTPVQERYQGYRNALADAGIEYNSDYYKQGELNEQEAQRLAKEVLSLPDPPTAIFAYSDTQAFGVLRAAQEMGVEVPEKLSVIGYDDIELAEYLQLTTIRQSLYQSGVRGAQLLLEQLDEPFPEPKEILLTTKLVVRSTTAPPCC